VDVAAPVVTPDVTAALNRVPDVLLQSGGGPVFQLVLNEATGPFASPAPAEDAPEETAAPTPAPEPTQAVEDEAGDAVATLRATFLASVPDELGTETGAEPSLAVLATLGPGAVTDPPVAMGGAGDVPGPVEVRVLVATGDPVRAALFEALTAAASAAGFELVEATPADPATALWEEPEAWDAAIVPVTQAELPIAGTVDRWRSGGATNVSGHADPALDTILDQLAGALAPAAVADLVGQTGAAVRDASVVVPLVRQPSVAATVDRGEDSDLPAVGEVRAVPWGLVDLSAWWSWAVTAPAG
jgi:peptide/nickel transport system substrate-binding protein